ncbi:MAG: hypothetical protein ACYC9W_06325 [Candidatus Limnocylindria bacterium]
MSEQNMDWSTRAKRRRSGYGAMYGSWLPGITLVALGVIFLAENYLGVTLRNWWALFILIPAGRSLAVAYGHWSGGDTSSAVGPLVAGLGFLVLTAAFLLDLPIGRLWPVFLIVAGLGLLAGRRSWT